MFLTTMQATFPKTAPGATGWREVAAVLLAITVVAAAFWAPGDLTVNGRMALAAFGLSVISWTLTKLNDTFVALLAAIGLVLTRTIDPDGFFASIGNSVVWLMIGAFIVARALNQSGLAARFTFAMTRGAHTIGQLFYLLTAVLLLTALVIPSTSGRAALLVPVYQAIAGTLQNERINRALALALPVNILLTAVGSLVGAGAHLVINDTLAQMVGSRFSFIEWMILGMPFAAISAFASTWVILRLFLTRQERSLRLDAYLRSKLPAPGPWTRQERYVGLVTAALVALWATEAWHGIDNALVAILGALAVTIPSFGALKFKDAAKGVEWEMILFVAASLALSEALVLSGAGRWLVDTLMVRSGLSTLESQLAILSGVVVITLTAHLYITSRSARGAVIAPLVILLALALEIDPRLLAWVTAAGVGYCITLVVSAKPLTMFQQMGGGQPAFSAGDLARLSGVLAPLHVALILLFAFFYWPLLLPPLPAAAANAEQSMHAVAPVMRQTPGLLGDRSLAPNALLDEAGIARVGNTFVLAPDAAACSCEVKESTATDARPVVVPAPASSTPANLASDVQPAAAPAPDAANRILPPVVSAPMPTAVPTPTPTATLPPPTPAPALNPGELDGELATWEGTDDVGDTWDAGTEDDAAAPLSGRSDDDDAETPATENARNDSADDDAAPGAADHEAARDDDDAAAESAYTKLPAAPPATDEDPDDAPSTEGAPAPDQDDGDASDAAAPAAPAQDDGDDAQDNGDDAQEAAPAPPVEEAPAPAPPPPPSAPVDDGGDDDGGDDDGGDDDGGDDD